MSNELTDEQKAMCNIDYMFKRKKVKNDQPERILQRNVCSFLKEQYPHVYFQSDSSGVRVSQGMANQLKQTRSNHAHLDIIILARSREHIGLILEAKSKTPFLQDGSLSTEKHIREQYQTMLLLESYGYKCHFFWELEQVKLIIKNYLGG